MESVTMKEITPRKKLKTVQSEKPVKENAFCSTDLLQIEFSQHTINRLKEDQHRLVSQLRTVTDKNDKLRSQNEELRLENIRLSDSLQSLKLSHDCNMGLRAENIKLSDKVEQLQGKVHEPKSRCTFCGQLQETKGKMVGQKEEISRLMHSNVGLMNRLEEEKLLRSTVSQEAVRMEQRIREIERESSELQRVYEQKIAVLEDCSARLRGEFDDAILQLKIYERDKEISELLKYEHTITGKQQKGETHRKKEREGDRVIQKEIKGDNQGDRQREVIEMMEHRHVKLEMQLQRAEERIKGLQNIICLSATPHSL